MVTYLLGAGASAKSIPVTSGLLDSMWTFIKVLESYQNDPMSKLSLKYDNIVIDPKDHHAGLYYGGMLLLTDASKHQTIDTYAKMLFFTDQTQKLQQLKVFLSCYFYWVQTLLTPDDRYDHFFASVLEKSDSIMPLAPIIPGKVKILTWNYDSQFELCFSRYIDPTQSYYEIKNKANICTKFDPFSESTFSVLKINGSSQIYNINNEQVFPLPDYSLYKVDKKYGIRDAILIYSLLNNAIQYKFQTMISFAWENNISDLNHSPSSGVFKSLENTETLVVIGYSFPFFNRKIDEFILFQMPQLRRIFLQSKDATVLSGLKSRLHSMLFGHMNSKLRSNIELIDDTSQFFIPYEL
ncbi:MAG: hypothetical protein IH597_14855 [Bacteroidales bacterium]|nr:hypothetical protein [Bacteroidales bacterium]